MSEPRLTAENVTVEDALRAAAAARLDRGDWDRWYIVVRDSAVRCGYRAVRVPAPLMSEVTGGNPNPVTDPVEELTGEPLIEWLGGDGGTGAWALTDAGQRRLDAADNDREQKTEETSKS